MYYKLLWTTVVDFIYFSFYAKTDAFHNYGLIGARVRRNTLVLYRGEEVRIGITVYAGAID
jgi:hypothetical protein